MKKSFLNFNSQKNKNLFHDRISFLLKIFIFISLFLVIYIFYIQIFKNQYYYNLSLKNSLKYTQLNPRRGDIYDRNGVLLASTLPTHSLELDREIADINKKKILESIKKEINFTEIDIKNFDNKKNLNIYQNAIILKSDLSEEEVAKVLSINHLYGGLNLISNLTRRFYHYGEITSHVIGNLGRIDEKDLKNIDIRKYRNAKYIGKTGAERYYEEYLYGKPGLKKVEVDVSGKEVKVISELPPIAGNDLFLTIDIRLQKFMYDQLNGYTGASVALDPRNGDILAMISAPAVNYNHVSHKSGEEKIIESKKLLSNPLFNRALNGLYSPGSTIKPIMALNGLYFNIIDSSTKIYAGSFFKLPGSSRRFRDWKPEGHGIVDVEKSIIQSCDVFFYNIAYKLGIEKISSFFKYFSFGEKLGIDVFSESEGIFPSKAWKRKKFGTNWNHGETVITGIGQGYFLATPMQLAYSTSIIANRGKILIPRLKKNTIQTKNKSTLKKENFLKNKINPEHWKLIVDSMFKVVNQQNGTAYWSTNNRNNNISGKTGTVQVYTLSQKNDKRDNNVAKHLRDHSLYIAFAPKENPEIVIATVIENVGSGSKYAAPISNTIINYYFDEILLRKKN